MQEKRHDRVVEMRLCFFLGKVGDYNVSFVETRMCRSTAKWTNRKVQSTDTVIGAEWLVVVKRVSEKKTERRSHSIQAE